MIRTTTTTTDYVLNRASHKDNTKDRVISPPFGKPKDPNLSLITMCVDRSGSMQTMGIEVVNGCNTFLDVQRKNDSEKGTETKIIFTTFDDKIEVSQEGISLKDVPSIAPETVAPRGMTALYDAIGDMLERTSMVLNNLEKEPNCVLCFILTDGAENSSQKWGLHNLQLQIAKLKSSPYNWSFTFAGANQDAIFEGGKFGIARNDCITFSPTPSKTESLFRAVSDSTTRVKCARVTDRGQAKAFTPQERHKTV